MYLEDFPQEVQYYIHAAGFGRNTCRNTHGNAARSSATGKQGKLLCPCFKALQGVTGTEREAGGREDQAGKLCPTCLLCRSTISEAPSTLIKAILNTSMKYINENSVIMESQDGLGCKGPSKII